MELNLAPFPRRNPCPTVLRAEQPRAGPKPNQLSRVKSHHGFTEGTREDCGAFGPTRPLLHPNHSAAFCQGGAALRRAQARFTPPEIHLYTAQVVPGGLSIGGNEAWGSVPSSGPASVPARPPPAHRGQVPAKHNTCTPRRDPKPPARHRRAGAVTWGSPASVPRPCAVTPTCQPRSRTRSASTILPLFWLLPSALCQSVLHHRSQPAPPSEPCTQKLKNIPPFCSCQLPPRGSSALLHF